MKKISETFKEYLAGLVEGDGAIHIPKTERSEKNKKNYPSIQISFNKKDYPLASKIVQVLGGGTINKVKEKKAYVITVNSVGGVETMIEILNGRMRTPKIAALYELIDWYEKVEKKKIIKKPRNESPLETNS